MLTLDCLDNASRSTSANGRAPDRLQERLAKAMAAKNAKHMQNERPDSLALSSGVPSRTASPATVATNPRQSLDVQQPLQSPTNKTADDKDVVESQSVVKDAVVIESTAVEKKENVPDIVADEGPLATEETIVSVDKDNAATEPDEVTKERKSVDVEPKSQLAVQTEQPRASLDSNGVSARSSIDAPRTATIPPIEPQSMEEYRLIVQQLRTDNEISELQRQEEIHDYVEKIDALQSKLGYLAKEAAEAARTASGSAPSGSSEKKLAEKDEQVALLMEEGQKLSKKELTHMTTIKKLRMKVAENSKDVIDAKVAQEKAERELAIVTEKLKRAEGAERRLAERQKQIAQLQKDKDSLKEERDSRDHLINNFKKQLQEADLERKHAETQAANEALQLERKRVKDLEDDIANAKIEKNLANDRAQAQIKELREKIDKDAEKARMTDLESKNELHMLESKLEVMRTRAEEASSGVTGDAQAKLLRQIETLQSQYAIASENWQGIEASLLARTTNLEKERDEATKREAEIRKKAREVVNQVATPLMYCADSIQTLKAKRNEDELEESRNRLPTFQQELAEQKAKLEALQKRAEAAEAALKEAKASFDQEKQALAAAAAAAEKRLEEEKQKWQDEAPTFSPVRADSPATSTRRGLTSEFLGLQNLQLRRASARSVQSDIPSPAQGAFNSRRPSQQMQRISSGHVTPIRQDSLQSLVQHTQLQNGDVAETPSVHTEQETDYYSRPSSPHQTINDLVSVSTAGAGPSVQLVERMSSAVRRLESEKASTKEDIARLSAQRDEARAEIVSLMREVEVKREKEEKVKELEAEVKNLNERWQTTLEMLGEKSEEVEELKGDIADLKSIYRDLVQRTVK